MAKVQLFLAKVPRDSEEQLEVILRMYRNLTGKEPTPEDREKTRKALARREEEKGKD